MHPLRVMEASSGSLAASWACRGSDSTPALGCEYWEACSGRALPSLGSRAGCGDEQHLLQIRDPSPDKGYENQQPFSRKRKEKEKKRKRGNKYQKFAPKLLSVCCDVRSRRRRPAGDGHDAGLPTHLNLVQTRLLWCAEAPVQTCWDSPDEVVCFLSNSCK